MAAFDFGGIFSREKKPARTNMMDYLTWRGDLTFSEAPYCQIDSLIFASMSYNDLTDDESKGTSGIKLRELAPRLTLWSGDGDKYFKQWRQLLAEMSTTERFGQVIIHDYTDYINQEQGIQFSAVTCDLPDGSVQVSFRGTGDSLAGWREDCAMAFECPVAAQTMAVEYLTRQAEICRVFGRKGIHVSGHSKGGNLASYAAAMLSPDLQGILLDVYSFDGPGLTEEILSSAGYAAIQSRLHSIIPQSSVVGLLLGYHPKYQVIYSFGDGLLQHDAFTWTVTGRHFIYMESTDATSKLMNSTIHQWLSGLSVERRRQFTDAIFSLVKDTNASTIFELEQNLPKTMASVLKNSIEMPAEDKKMLAKTIRDLIAAGAGNVFLNRKSEI